VDRAYENAWGSDPAVLEKTAAAWPFSPARGEPDHKVAWSIYLLDPDSHLIEITTYEPAS